MTENEHTPSPWFVVSGRYIYHQHINELDNPDDIEVARVSHPRDLPVIAAAPDLLEACELQEHADRLRDAWLCNQDVPGHDNAGDHPAWHEALGLAEEARRAAIAKARGNDVPTDA